MRSTEGAVTPGPDLSHLPALSPAEVLDRLAHPPGALATLWLHGGLALTGTVVKVDNGTVMVLEAQGALSYIALGAVMGVRVHPAHGMEGRLTPGGGELIECAPEDEAPTHGDLQRYLASRDGIPVNMPWEALASDASRHSAKQLLIDLDMALTSIGQQYGFAVLAPITRIYLRPAARPELERKRDALRVGFHPEAGAAGRPSVERLRVGIASLL